MRFFHFHKWLYEWKEIIVHFDHPDYGDIKSPMPFKFRACECGKIQYQQPRPYGEWKDDDKGLINTKEVYTEEVCSIKGI